jgi:hypothetical protein
LLREKLFGSRKRDTEKSRGNDCAVDEFASRKHERPPREWPAAASRSRRTDSATETRRHRGKLTTSTDQLSGIQNSGVTD